MKTIKELEKEIEDLDCNIKRFQENKKYAKFREINAKQKTLKEVLGMIEEGQYPSIVGDNNVKEFLNWKDKLKSKIEGE